MCLTGQHSPAAGRQAREGGTRGGKAGQASRTWHRTPRRHRRCATCSPNVIWRRFQLLFFWVCFTLPFFSFYFSLFSFRISKLALQLIRRCSRRRRRRQRCRVRHRCRSRCMPRSVASGVAFQYLVICVPFLDFRCVCVRFFRKELSKLKRQQQQQEQEATPARNVLVFIFLFLSFALLYSIPYCNSFAFVSRSFLISFYLQVSSFLFGLSPPPPAYLKFSLSCKLNCTQCFFWRDLNINYALAMH